MIPCDICDAVDIDRNLNSNHYDSGRNVGDERSRQERLGRRVEPPLLQERT